MKAKHISVRMDRTNGDLWLTEERLREPVRRIKNITGDVLLALSAEIVSVDGTKEAHRDVEFSDGTKIRLTVTDLTPDPEAIGPPAVTQV